MLHGLLDESSSAAVAHDVDLEPARRVGRGLGDRREGPARPRERSSACRRRCAARGVGSAVLVRQPLHRRQGDRDRHVDRGAEGGSSQFDPGHVPRRPRPQPQPIPGRDVVRSVGSSSARRRSSRIRSGGIRSPPPPRARRGRGGQRGHELVGTGSGRCAGSSTAPACEGGHGSCTEHRARPRRAACRCYRGAATTRLAAALAAACSRSRRRLRGCPSPEPHVSRHRPLAAGWTAASGRRLPRRRGMRQRPRLERADAASAPR